MSEKQDHQKRRAKGREREAEGEGEGGGERSVGISGCLDHWLELSRGAGFAEEGVF